MMQPRELSGLEFDLTTNGLRFLQRSIDAADQPQPDHQALAFAITDLAAAVEVLMKARLAREHWTLIFADPDKVTVATVLAGAAKTVGPEQAFKRLENLAGVSWHHGNDKTAVKSHRDRVDELAQLRNRTIHFTTASIPAPALATCWGRGLDLAIWLLDTEFREQAAAEVHDLVEETIDSLASRAGQLKDLRTERLKTIADELSSADVLLVCPRCGQGALAMVSGQAAHCAYCVWKPVDGSEAATEYVNVVLGTSEYEVVKDGGEWSIHECLNCAEQALTEGIEPVILCATHLRSYRCDPELPISWGCFSCGLTTTVVDRCTRCGAVADIGLEEVSLCSNCAEYAFDRF